MGTERKADDIPEITPEMIEAGATAIYEALPEAFSWKSSAALDVARRVFLAMMDRSHTTIDRAPPHT